MNLFRVILVIATLVLAAVLATPPGRLPLALRGLAKMMRRDNGLPSPAPDARASTARRLAAFVLVLVAAVLALAKF